MNTSKPESHDHELPSDQSHFAFLKDLFSEGKFAEFWHHLGFNNDGLIKLQSELNALESEVPQRHTWTHSSTNVMAAESAPSPEPSANVRRPGPDHLT